MSFSSLMEDNNVMAIGSEPSDTDSQGTIYNRIPYYTTMAGAKAVVEAIKAAETEHPLVIASVTGTDNDPQSSSAQEAKLAAAGVLVAPSNADAVGLALACLRSVG